MADADLSTLVRAAADGDENAWAVLIERFMGLVWSVARNYRLDDATAADVVQETWTRLAQNLDRIREPERVGSWLATTARNEALRCIKAVDRERPESFETEELLEPRPAADDQLLIAERNERLVRALERLPEDEQLLLRLTLAEPKIPYEEIAEILGRPIGSLGPTRQRVLAKLRRMLGEKP